jgi:hypothetical protein
MNILVPKQVQEALLRHRQFIEKPRSPISLSELNTRLYEQVEKLRVIASNLDGSELETMKHELQVLYVLLVRLQISLGEAHNPELANIFVVRRLEQDELPIREIREVLPEALENIRGAIKRKDLIRVWAGIGRLYGACFKI